VLTQHAIINIDLSAQSLRAQLGTFTKSYSISSAKNGAGQLSGSGCTPLGHHIIRAKIGNGAAPNSVFSGRRFTGEIYTPELAKCYPERDWILTRILWLSGKELQYNRLGEVDSMRRYIYIHGTPDSEPMGIPLSHGCIRMRNADVVELFDLLPVGTGVYIYM
jgi:lipoprotein-anchoring transpeptidase ErfK/SrfK